MVHNKIIVDVRWGSNKASKKAVICGTFVFRNNQRLRLFHLENHPLEGNLGVKGVLFSSPDQREILQG